MSLPPAPFFSFFTEIPLNHTGQPGTFFDLYPFFGDTIIYSLCLTMYHTRGIKMITKLEVGKTYRVEVHEIDDRNTVARIVARNDETGYISFRFCDEFGEEYGRRIVRKVCTYDCVLGGVEYVKVKGIDNCICADCGFRLKDATKSFRVGVTYIGRHTDGYNICYKVVGRDDDHEHVNLQRCTESGLPMGDTRSVRVDVDPVWSGDMELIDLSLGRYTSVILRADRFLEGQ